MNVKSIVSIVRPSTRKQVEVISAHVRAFKKALKELSKSIWQQIMVSLAACCVSSGAAQGFVPYQRLKRSRSTAGASEAESKEVYSFPPDVHISLSKPSDGLSRSQSVKLKVPDHDEAENTVFLKFSVLGDCETGKTSFLAKYASVDRDDEYVQTMGVSSMEKIFRVQNANIALRIWDLGGHWQCENMLPVVCQDAAAILIMFDLTRRSTLHSVKQWYLQAREWNKTAIPVIIGTKYDQFVQMPQDIQLAIIRQATFYAKAMGASLFFSSVTHNINVHKIFKVIVAKLFDLPCNISRNLKFGEPIIDY